MEPGAVVVFSYVHLVTEVMIVSILSGTISGRRGILGCILIIIIAGLDVARRDLVRSFTGRMLPHS